METIQFFRSCWSRSCCCSFKKFSFFKKHSPRIFIYVTRGIGKTSIARILAKALNCSELIDNTEPCNACESCTSINEGAAIDFIEIDAASRKGIEDTKNLLETISYLPRHQSIKSI